MQTWGNMTHREGGCSGDGCLATEAIQLVGSELKLTVLHGLMGGPRRFNDLRASTGICQSSLVKTLRELERAGLTERRVGIGSPPTVEYTLTEKGADLHEAIAGIEAWTERWLAQAALGPARKLTLRRKTPW